MRRVKICPFCGSDEVWVVRATWESSVPSRQPWVVQCQECCATGPQYHDEERARLAWCVRWPDTGPAPAPMSLPEDCSDHIAANMALSRGEALHVARRWWTYAARAYNSTIRSGYEVCGE